MIDIQTEGQMDVQIDNLTFIGDCRITFVTENNSTYRKIVTELLLRKCGLALTCI